LLARRAAAGELAAFAELVRVHEPRLRALLRREMEAQGFTVYGEEWWHYDFGGWRDWGLGNRTFDELSRPR